MFEKDNRKFITFVCTGNTCRSPMAESLFKHAVKNDPDFNNFIISSAGVCAWDGTHASDYAIKVLQDCGIDLSHHRSKAVTQSLIDKSAIILCMTTSHKEILESEFKTGITPIFLLREFLPDNTNKNIPDPFGRNLDAYKNSRDNIVEAIPSIIKYIKEHILKK